MGTDEPFDVVAVGARCAGSPLAALLAREGVRVCVVEKATFPADTLSTNFFQADGLAFLDQLGVTEQLRATGAPFITRTDFSVDGNLMRSLCECEPVAAALDGARRVGKVLGIVRFSGFFRDPSGPGWALAGDAGHFKDPCAGRGIGDAFRQVDALAPAIIDGLRGSDRRLDATLAEWGRWRDRELAEYYWQAVDLGKAGPFPTPTPDLLRRLEAHGKLDLFFNLMSHRGRPSQVLTPRRVLAATGRVLARRGCDKRAVLRELGTLTVQDTRRRRLNRHPVYSDDDPIHDRELSVE